jgi:uncharacterized membrane protein YccC
VSETAAAEPPVDEPVLPPDPKPTSAAATAMVAASGDARAVEGIRRAKGFGGLAGFAVTALAAHMHGELMASMLARALLGGIAGYMVSWLAAVTVWRRILRAEVHHSFREYAGARAAAAESDAQ